MFGDVEGDVDGDVVLVDTDLEGMRTGVEGWGERDELPGLGWDIFSK